MSEKNIILSTIWRSEDFVVTDSRIQASEDECILTINENTSKIIIQIPRHFSLVTKKIIERRVQSIAKSGFLVPKSQLRIGAGFEVEITKDEFIPDVLLQEGHKYSLEAPVPVEEPPKEAVKEETEEEYIPTFLSQEAMGTDTQPTVQTEVEPYLEQRQHMPTEEIKPSVVDDDSISGRFIIALAKLGDVYVTQKNNHYSIEYSAGRVDFQVNKGEIEILLTKRIPPDDQTLNQAKAAATGKTGL
jgi:hypothetical protein